MHLHIAYLVRIVSFQGNIIFVGIQKNCSEMNNVWFCLIYYTTTSGLWLWILPFETFVTPS